MLHVNFPHEALLLKETAQQLAAFLVTFVLNLVVLLVFRVTPSWGVILLPLVALPLFFIGSAIGLVISMVNIVTVDLSRCVGAAVGLLMFTTPLIYGDNVESPLVQTIIKYNPLTYLVCSCRDVVIYGRLYDGNVQAYFLSAATAFLLFLVSWRLFYIGEQKVIERAA